MHIERNLHVNAHSLVSERRSTPYGEMVLDDIVKSETREIFKVLYNMHHGIKYSVQYDEGHADWHFSLSRPCLARGNCLSSN